jgi:hypothetical protein
MADKLLIEGSEENSTPVKSWIFQLRTGSIEQ